MANQRDEETQDEQSQRFAGFHYSNQRRNVVGPDGQTIALRPQSLEVFRVLARHHDSVVTKERLFELVWPNTEVTDDSLVQCVGDIRRMIGDSGRDVLKTVPRRGYMLVADAPVTSESGSGDGIGSGIAPGQRQTKPDEHKRQNARRGVIVASIVVMFFASGAWLISRQQAPEPVVASVPVPTHSESLKAPTVTVAALDDVDARAEQVLDFYLAELRQALSRYKTVRLVQSPPNESDYQLSVNIKPIAQSGFRLLVEMIDNASGAVFSTRSFDVPINAAEDVALLRSPAIRTAAFASPAGGALSRHLMAMAFHKPASKLTPTECYAHAYDCTSCEGAVATLTERTKVCLNNLLDKNPDDPSAWALKASLHAHQYRWGSALSEPERTDLQARKYLKKLATEAATTAEALSNGQLPVVYWGMVQAYSANCEIDKMRTAIDRALELNPNDPGMLAVFGNFLAFGGRWDEGIELIDRALALEPEQSRPWWHYAKAKNQINQGQYEEALGYFHTAFQERNWASHLNFAYTLSHLGREADAQKAVNDLLRLNPGYTVEKATQFYQLNCFNEQYVDKVRQGLTLAGMPSRTKSLGVPTNEPVAAKILHANGAPFEYIDIGSGEPVLFVHGALGDYRGWGDYELPISEKHRFISMTQRHFGSQSGPQPQEPPGLQIYTDDLIAFIEALNAGPIHLVTWSFSGRVGLQAQGSRPDLFKSAIHFEPPIRDLALGGEEPSPDMLSFMAKIGPIMKMYGAGDHQGAATNFIETVFEQEPGGFYTESVGFQRVILDNARTIPLSFSTSKMLTCDYLAKIETPTLVVRGEESNDFFRRSSQRVAQCLPNARDISLAGVKHDGPVRRVAEFSEIIRQHVDRHAAARL